MKLGPSESLLLPNAPPPSMVSLDMACDAQPELYHRDSFVIQDLANSQESSISLLQESGARPTRQRVAQILQPEMSQGTRVSYYKDPLAGMDAILDDTAAISEETDSIVVECPCLIRKVIESWFLVRNFAHASSGPLVPDVFPQAGQMC